jgi:tRNA(fMet)-specific endonuclease VapC
MRFRFSILQERRSELQRDVDDFLRRLNVLVWDSAAAAEYADIRSDLQGRGTPIGGMDLMIAAHARSLGATLVTNNERHFRRVNHLRVENWAR